MSRRQGAGRCIHKTNYLLGLQYISFEAYDCRVTRRLEKHNERRRQRRAEHVPENRPTHRRQALLGKYMDDAYPADDAAYAGYHDGSGDGDGACGGYPSSDRSEGGGAGRRGRRPAGYGYHHLGYAAHMQWLPPSDALAASMYAQLSASTAAAGLYGGMGAPTGLQQQQQQHLQQQLAVLHRQAVAAEEAWDAHAAAAAPAGAEATRPQRRCSPTDSDELAFTGCTSSSSPQRGASPLRAGGPGCVTDGVAAAAAAGAGTAAVPTASASGAAGAAPSAPLLERLASDDMARRLHWEADALAAAHGDGAAHPVLVFVPPLLALLSAMKAAMSAGETAPAASGGQNGVTAATAAVASVQPARSAAGFRDTSLHKVCLSCARGPCDAVHPSSPPAAPPCLVLDNV